MKNLPKMVEGMYRVLKKNCPECLDPLIDQIIDHCCKIDDFYYIHTAHEKLDTPL